MKFSQLAASGSAIVVIVVGMGTPWLAVDLYYEMSHLIPLSWAWVQAFGWLLDISVQLMVVLALLKLLGYRVRGVFVGSGQWLEPTSMVKLLVLLVLTGLSLDYLWQLPWFEMYPGDLFALSQPDSNSQTFSDDEKIEVGPAVLTTLLMLTAGPIVEEIFYRGLMLRTLMAVLPVGWAIAFSSLLFSLYHLNDPLAAAFFSATLSIVYLQTRSLYSCIALHIAYNVEIALSQLLTITFPDWWYKSLDMFRADSWWLHATILAVSAVLAFDYARSVRRSKPGLSLASTLP